MEKIPLTSEVIHGFVNSCLVKGFDGQLQTPEFHKEMWDLCCSKNKNIAIAAPRGHAKSTAITLSYTLASVLFRNKKFVMIVSDTESQAVYFLGQIKAELSANENIVDLFGLKKDGEGKVKFIKDTETDIIVAFDNGDLFRIVAKGAEQKVRGTLWNGMRPDLVVIDDLENDELVMNKDRREKLRRWFYGALIPCLSLNGQIRYVGTILHLDALLERLMPREGAAWTQSNELKTWSTKVIGGWMAVKYKAHNQDYKQILWPAKWTRAGLMDEREKYVVQGMGDVYSQEYLNLPLDEKNTYFKKADFLPMTLNDEEKKLNFYITADLAISQRDRADYSVFIVGGVDENGNLLIVNVLRERMDGREIVETILGLQRAYNPMVFGIEEMQVSKAIGPFLREEMIKRNVYVNLQPLKPNKEDKVLRTRSIQARMRAQAVRFDKNAEWYNDLESEMLRFPRDRHDDQVDAMAYLGLMLDSFTNAPTREEQDEEEYMESLGENNTGRNRTTGY